MTIYVIAFLIFYFISLLRCLLQGFGTRMRDEVARDHVGKGTLYIDSMPGKVHENNKTKYGYKDDFKVHRYKRRVPVELENNCDYFNSIKEVRCS